MHTAMPGCIGSIVAALWLMSALSGAAAQERTEPALDRQPIPETREETGAEPRQAGARPIETDADRLVPAIKTIEGAIRDLIPEENPEYRERQEHRELADLHAQQDMAFWAKAMFWAAVVSLFLTAIGIWLIWRTLVHRGRGGRSEEEHCSGCSSR